MTENLPAILCAKLLPNLAGKRGIELRLIDLVREARLRNPAFDSRAAPAMEAIINEYESAQRAEFSYGGWMENRESLFKGTYMDADRRYIHLGVDINAAAGTPVCFPYSAEVIAVSTSNDNEVGWGTRVDLKHPHLPLVFLIGHLDPHVAITAGQAFKACAALGAIGAPAVNGNVDPHLHLQAMDLTLYRQLCAASDLDGYGQVRHAALLPNLFPDPLRALSYFGEI